MSFSNITKNLHNSLCEILILYKNLKNDRNHIRLFVYYNLLDSSLITINCEQIKNNFHTAELLFKQGSSPILKVILDISLPHNFGDKFVDNGSIFKNINFSYYTSNSNINIFNKYSEKMDYNVDTVKIINNQNKLNKFFKEKFSGEYNNLLKYLYNIDN